MHIVVATHIYNLAELYHILYNNIVYYIISININKPHATLLLKDTITNRLLYITKNITDTFYKISNDVDYNYIGVCANTLVPGDIIFTNLKKNSKECKFTIKDISGLNFILEHDINTYNVTKDSSSIILKLSAIEKPNIDLNFIKTTFLELNNGDKIYYNNDIYIVNGRRKNNICEDNYRLKEIIIFNNVEINDTLSISNSIEQISISHKHDYIIYKVLCVSSPTILRLINKINIIEAKKKEYEDLLYICNNLENDVNILKKELSNFIEEYNNNFNESVQVQIMNTINKIAAIEKQLTLLLKNV